MIKYKHYKSKHIVSLREIGPETWAWELNNPIYPEEFYSLRFPLIWSRDLSYINLQEDPLVVYEDKNAYLFKTEADLTLFKLKYGV